MERLIPKYVYKSAPSSAVAMSIAIGKPSPTKPMYFGEYITKREFSKCIEKELGIKKYIEYRASRRMLLKDFITEDRAIVRTDGGYVFVEANKYYSFKDCDNNKVIAVWFV